MMRKIYAALLVVAISGCAVTQQVQPKADTGVATSGFLGDYSQLQPGGKDQALLVYINPNARWSQYNAVMIDPITLGLGTDTTVSDADQQTLSSYYYHALEQDLTQQNYTIVDKPGPGVLRLRVALTDASKATPGLRTVSVIVPQARLLGLVKNLSTGTYAFVGSAQSEGEILDSVTGQRLAAAVDHRSGGLSVKNAAVWKWGDAENAMDFWAHRLAQRLADMRDGAIATSQ
jgi:hypothetical protein